MAEGPRDPADSAGKKNHGKTVISGSEGQDLDRTSWKGVGGRKTDKKGFVEEG